MDEPLRKANLETSAINQAEAASVTGGVLADTLKTMGYRPVIGLHTIYELGRAFLNRPHDEKARRRFCILRDLEPSFVPLVADLLHQEILKLRTGAAVLPFLNHLDHISTQQEINQMANGTISPKGEKFIRDREQAMQRDLPVQSQAYLRHVAEVKAGNPAIQRMRTFEQVLSYFSGDLAGLIREVLKNTVSQTEADELAARLDSFPALRSVVRANVYRCFIHIAHEQPAGKDKISDPRQVIDASYSDALVTNDRQLARLAQQINPDLTVLLWKSLVTTKAGAAPS